MITKEQALTADEFIQTAYIGLVKNTSIIFPNDYHQGLIALVQSAKWRRNGATKVWKSASRSEHFRIPVKCGLYQYGYIEFTKDSDNHELFEVAL